MSPNNQIALLPDKWGIFRCSAERTVQHVPKREFLRMFSVNHEYAWGAICQSWNNSEMFEEPVERAQTFLHFAAIHPHSHPFTEYIYISTLILILKKKRLRNERRNKLSKNVGSIIHYQWAGASPLHILHLQLKGPVLNSP